MCEKCGEIDKTIERYRRILRSISDQITVDRTKELIAKGRASPLSRRGKEALAEVRLLACREGWCYHHVQAIIVSIDQYAESAFGNRNFFLNRPHGSGWNKKGDVP
jgi:hypothetical protein